MFLHNHGLWYDYIVLGVHTSDVAPGFQHGRCQPKHYNIYFFLLQGKGKVEVSFNCKRYFCYSNINTN